MRRLVLIAALLACPVLARAEGMYIGNWPAKFNCSGSTVPVNGVFWQATQPVSGSITVTNLPAVQTTTPLSAATSTLTTVTVSSASSVVLASNAARKGLIILNASAQTLYISYDLTATAAKHATTQIAAQGTWVMPYPIYLGTISAIRTSGSDAADFTELN